jgi:hypothetical protein
MMLGKVTHESLSVEAARIARVLAVDPSVPFAVTAAAEALGVSEVDLLRRIVDGEVEAVRAEGEVVIPWAEVVSLGLELWGQDSLDEALSALDTTTVPELLRSSTLAVQLPRMTITALQHVARREGRPVSDVLAAELRDFLSAHSEWLSAEVPAFADAFAWPFVGE